MTFDSLGIAEPILKALENKGYSNPTPIQAQAIPILLEHKDLLGCAQTGTGKTAAFTIPIIQNLIKSASYEAKGRRTVKSLIVTPTRELAIQIADNITAYAKYTSLKSTVIFGGVTQGKQKAAIKGGIDILVATPGRLLDYIGQGVLSLSDIEYFVLDEADQMLDMGFIHDIKRIIKLLPKKRQSLFFSATMPKSIVELSNQILGNPERVTIKPKQATAEKVSQALYYVAKREKLDLLIHLINRPGEENKSTLVFSRTKHGADRIVRKLKGAKIEAAAIHGNKSQVARQRALGDFKKGKINVLIATDIAARGIDVSELEYVINYDLPNVPETYVHRIGRTGRADASGLAISFCDGVERAYLRDIERLINQKIPLVEDHPYPDDGTIPDPPPQQNNRNNNRRGPRNEQRNGQRGSQGRNNRNQDDRRKKSGGASNRRSEEGRSDRRTEGRSERREGGRREDNRNRNTDKRRSDSAANSRDRKPDSRNNDQRNAPRKESDRKSQRPASKKQSQKRKPNDNRSRPKNIQTREDKLKWPLL